MSLVGSRIESRRLEMGLRVVELSSKVGIHKSAMRLIERGLRFPRCDTLLKLCEALDVSSDWLMGRSVRDRVNESLLREMLEGMVGWEERDKRVFCDFVEFLVERNRNAELL